MRRWMDGIAGTVTSLDTVWQSQLLIERGTARIAAWIDASSREGGLGVRFPPRPVPPDPIQAPTAPVWPY
jgi:hypothetical protein